MTGNLRKGYSKFIYQLPGNPCTDFRSLLPPMTLLKFQRLYPNLPASRLHNRLNSFLICSRVKWFLPFGVGQLPNSSALTASQFSSCTLIEFCGLISSLEMLLSDWLWFFNKTIIALSGWHFEYFFTFSQNNYTCLRSRDGSHISFR